MSGNVVDLCPVGALGDKRLSLQAARLVHEAARRRLHRLLDRLFDPGRRESGHGLSPQAARESARQPVVDVRRGALRLSPRPQSPQRELELRHARRRAAGSTSSGRRPWTKSTTGSARPPAWASSLSPHLTVEEAYLLAKYARSIDPQALIALGPVPIVGEDERFPERLYDSRPRNAPIAAASRKWWPTSWAAVPRIEDLLDRRSRPASCADVWVSGGYKSPWIDAATAARFRRLGNPGRAGYVQLSLVDAGDVSIARRRLRRDAKAPTSTMPTACKPPVGDPSAGRRAGRGGRLLADCWGSRGCTKPAACSTKSPPRFAIFPSPPIRCRRSASI